MMFQNKITNDYEEIDRVLYGRALIEMAEKYFLGTQYDFYHKSFSKRIVWQKILRMRNPAVNTLKQVLKESKYKYVSVEKFPDQIYLAYKFFSDRIHVNTIN